MVGDLKVASHPAICVQVEASGPNEEKMRKPRGCEHFEHRPSSELGQEGPTPGIKTKTSPGPDLAHGAF